jgi:Protein of unknown function (DUF664)
MTWVAPEVVRVAEPLVGEERVILQGYLGFVRATLLVKCAGLTGEQLALRSVPPSTLSLLGLVRHVTEVERNWFRRRFGSQEIDRLYWRADRPDAAFDDVDPARAEEDIARLTAEWRAADEAVAALDLDHVFHHDRFGPMSLRWAYSHMIGEYDRHNGHADLLRERIDGTTGD